MNDSIRISSAANGYIVEARDPEIVAENSKKDSCWQSPYVSIICKTPEELSSVVAKLLPVLSMDTDEDADMESAFEQAVKEASK